ncbi:hypothetical protein ACIBJD_20955 [Kitasatospora sp. NPDC050467]|uniref:hypothetical protein n=1 Tax=Kitasatospora sp. NPDC050467 TaxID=3364053 RepID=UPI0037B8664B
MVGFDEIVANKYLPCIRDAIEAGYVDSYSVIDLESERSTIEERIHGVDLKPREVVYLPEAGSGATALRRQPELIGAAIRQLRLPELPMKVYIATEVRAHEAYLRYCVENGIDSLVEKPVLAPLVDGRFAPSRITEVMQELIAQASRTGANHSVMTLSRYHRIYNGELLRSLEERVQEWQAPITSFHLRAAGGVWNLQHEYESRDDHPYRYGYGMVMHGAYHYIDLAVQCLSLNKLVFPDRRFRLEVSSFGAFPTDQHLRIPNPTASRFEDGSPRWPYAETAAHSFGETDITATFRLVDVASDRTLTVGTLSFEQTTPSIRSWQDLPDDVYNKNGRTSSVDLEAQLSTLYSAHVHCYDVPRGQNADKIDAFARLTTRANASLLPNERYTSVNTFDGLFHSDSNRQLMENWLQGTENRSSLSAHLLPMKVTEALASSLLTPGRAVEIAEF